MRLAAPLAGALALAAALVPSTAGRGAEAVAAAPARAGAPAVPGAPPSRAAATRGRTAVGVAQREFRISVYRRSVRRGVIRFNVRNFGEDAHNLVLRGPRGFRSRRTGDIRAGRTARLTVRLSRPGRYRLLCTKGGHHRLGMTAALRVRR